MILFSRWQNYCGVVALVLLTAPLSWAAPAPSAEEPSKDGTPAERTRKSLDQVRDFDIVEQSLVQAVDTLKKQTKIHFILDLTSITGMGLDPNATMVTVNQKGTKIRSALRSMLTQHELCYVILGDTVLITSEDMAIQRQMKQLVSLDLEDVPLKTALRQLSKDTAANLMLDAKLKKEGDTTVSLHLDDVPLDTAMRLLTEAAGLKPVRIGNVLYVTSKANANEIRNDPETVQAAAEEQQRMQIKQQQRLQEMMNMRAIGGGFAIPAVGVVPVAPPPPPADVPAPDPDKKP
jgi:hypothetical protein